MGAPKTKVTYDSGLGTIDKPDEFDTGDFWLDPDGDMFIVTNYDDTVTYLTGKSAGVYEDIDTLNINMCSFLPAVKISLGD